MNTLFNTVIGENEKRLFLASLHKNWMNLLAKQVVQCSKCASLLPSGGHFRNNMLVAGEQEKWSSVVTTSMNVDCNVI